MTTISTTIDFKGHPVKIENNKVYLQHFGTTGPGQTPHHFWVECAFKNLNSELQKQLIDNNLIKNV